MHLVMNPGFAAYAPYNIAQVDLAEGVRVTTNVVGIDNAALRIGMPLDVVFEPAGGDIHLPKFRPAA